MMSKIKICDIAEQIRGVSYKPSDIYDTLNNNSVILLRANNIFDGKINFDDVVYVDKSKVSEKQYLKKGDILICASSGSKQLVGKAASVTFDAECTFGAFCKVVRPIGNIADYLGVYFQSNAYRRKIFELAIGANINNIKNEHIDSLEIPAYNGILTDSFVDKIFKTQTIIEKRKQQLQQLDELVKARFVELFYSSNEVVRLDSLIKPYRAVKCGQNTYPVLSITMHNGLVLQSERFKKEIASGDKSQYKVVPRNKLVVAFPIDEGLLSAQTIVDVGIVSPAYSLYDIDENKIYPEVLEYILRSDLSIQYYKSKLRGTTLRRRMIPKSDFDSMPINLPSIDRQKQFLNEIKEIDKSKFVVQKALDEAQTLFDSLMQEYFG